MEKKLFYTAWKLIALLLLTSCANKSDLNQSIYFVENIKQIQDSIVKLKSYKAKVIICSLKKTSNHTVLTLSVPEIPYVVKVNYKYKLVKGVPVLFVNYNEKRTNQEIPKQLIEENILTFDGEYNNTEAPYLEFVFCENDFNKIKCFDHIMLDDLDQEYRKKGKVFNEDMLVEKCK